MRETTLWVLLGSSPLFHPSTMINLTPARFPGIILVVLAVTLSNYYLPLRKFVRILLSLSTKVGFFALIILLPYLSSQTLHTILSCNLKSNIGLSQLRQLLGNGICLYLLKCHSMVLLTSPIKKLSIPIPHYPENLTKL